MAEMMPQSALVPDSDYIIIGGTGDLALRKIFPALFWRFLDGQVTSSFRLIAAARQEISKKDFADRLRPFCEEALSHADTKDADFKSFLKLVHLVKLDILSGEGADRLATLVHEKAKADRPCIFYLAVAPSLFGPSCQLLKSAGVVLPQSRLVVEKPLGHDYASAEAIGTEL
ncbi:MAG: glucose-6-phosphate dehydrogenase, partial [Alphaproteobacteria bacterium]|nr:glucose-6-phosphate dehydrogenase [Alphaproteobacteria bacterium]